ncbi:MAG TPA: hypothetical protein VGR62_11020 [Candidatus Binatia bacterium]|jgi:hypothetical protein|nr:hypothetical protein [Candidatus Binatia bacterium]
MRRALRIVVLVLVSVAVVWWVARRQPAPDDATPIAETEPADAPGETPPRADDVNADTLANDPLANLREAPRGPWAAVDMKALQATIPANLYWTMSSPTKDEAMLEWRAEERDRWNVEYGKVLSGTGTEEEVTAYYAYRQRLSNDYVEFAGYVLAHYGDTLPAQDVQLLKLAMDMHLVRLEEMPRQLAEAQDRRRAHEEARRAWLAEQQAFQGDAVPND